MSIQYNAIGTKGINVLLCLMLHHVLVLCQVVSIMSSYGKYLREYSCLLGFGPRVHVAVS